MQSIAQIKEIIVEDGITTISGNAFYGCNNVEKVLLPESLETIGNDAFGFCEKLKEIAEKYGVENTAIKDFSDQK